MKKLVAPLLLPALFLGACSPHSGTRKIEPLFGHRYDSSLSFEENLKAVDYVSLSSMVDDGDDFALLVYDRESTCACWGYSFQPIVERYLKERNLLLYAIQIDELRNKDDLFGMKVTEDASIALFDDGTLLYEEISKTGYEWSEDYEIFSSWMDERISYSAIEEISLSTFESLFAGDESFLVMFGRNTCSDCSYVEDNFLRESELARENGFYYIDCDVSGIRYDENGEYDEEAWTEFKDKYGLSEANNKKMGYGVGYVPTWIYYNLNLGGANEAVPSSMVGDMCVYFNDAVGTVDGAIEITDSFYSKPRIDSLTWLSDTTYGRHEELYALASSIVGTKLTPDEVNGSEGAYYLKPTKAASFHDVLLEGFLEYYLA